ncbi:hypothetical protein [Thalassobacillus sp. CUG 92003]|uniref:hypothetical protein n=1 Tax=Thalassobacillus sp. CUG 92003 TaxID=2736641 RepID=UPI0015E76B31|nr:hypothetical protein [Thalassobacillus sp. CUG 92003]
MLRNHDLEFMKSSHEDIRQNRTTPVSIVQRVKTGEDPLTGEPIYSEEPVEVDVIWSAATGDEDIQYIAGVKIQAGDYLVSFPLTVDLTDVENVTKDGVSYKIIERDKLGITPSRTEALVRRVV